MTSSRKGTAVGSGIIYFVFFLMIALIMGGIYAGIVIYFGEPYDYRQEEANSILKKVKDCISNEDIIHLNKASFFEKCHINQKVIEDGEHLIYINNGINELSIGVNDYILRCSIDVKTTNIDLPLCAKFNSTGYYIITASSQHSRKVLA